MPRLALVALTLAAVAAAPAGAQIAGKRDSGRVPAPSPFLEDSRLPGPGVGKELRDIDRRIDRTRESGRLSGREARRFEREARAIGRLARRYGRDGLSPSERAELELAPPICAIRSASPAAAVEANRDSDFPALVGAPGSRLTLSPG